MSGGMDGWIRALGNCQNLEHIRFSLSTKTILIFTIDSEHKFYYYFTTICTVYYPSYNQHNVNSNAQKETGNLSG